MTEKQERYMNPTALCPLVPLDDFVIFPEMTVIFDVGEELAVKAVEAAFYGDRFILASLRIGEPSPGESPSLHTAGTLCEITHLVEQQKNSLRISVKGLARVSIGPQYPREDYYVAPYARCAIEPCEVTREVHALNVSAIVAFNRFVDRFANAPQAASLRLANRDDPGYTADYIAQNLPFSPEVKQNVLEETAIEPRLRLVTELLHDEVERISIEFEVEEKLHERMNEASRENYLRERIRVMQEELGDAEDGEPDDYTARIQKAELEPEIAEKLLKENDRLRRQGYGSPEAALLRSYLDACLELPWHKSTRERLDIAAASRILEKDHYGLAKVKERILEYLAVRKLSPELKGGILCLVGPPGVGKTSVAISIARATNRKLARMSLGGVHDEAEIRGHRKTYIGAMPGRIMQAITQSGVNNPLLLLDEIDKLGSDYRGDPSSALLEALDPEQNTSFRDHYLEIPFDLSHVFFITTANTLDTIPRPLLDRMEVIELGSYTDEEKLHIAKQYLVPKERKKHGLDGRRLKISDEALRAVITGYTRESGVRQLEREIATLCRKAAAKLVEGDITSVSFKPADLGALLGPVKFKPERLAGKDAVGIVNGLAWTQVGGELLEVECAVLEGSGKLELTGNLGDVMKESAHAAVTCLRARAVKLGLEPNFYKEKDIHLHFPEGATPKDGPSAGITIATAVFSALSGLPIRRDIAMTGEITITGRVLPIGGLKEKTMAAYRNGVTTVLIPRDNEADLEEIDPTVREGLTFLPVSTLDDVIGAVTAPRPAEKKSPRRKMADIAFDTPQA